MQINIDVDELIEIIQKKAEQPNYGDLSIGVSCGLLEAINIIQEYCKNNHKA